MPTVLIVDDAAFMRMMLKDILCGYQVVGKRNGQRAIDYIKSLSRIGDHGHHRA